MSTSIGSVFAQIKSVGESMDTSIRMPCDLVYEYKGDQLYYCDSFDTAAATNPAGGTTPNDGLLALARLQQQGVLVACLDQNYSATTALGYIDIEYVVDFYEPKNFSYSQYALSTSPTIERKILHYVFEELIPYLAALPAKDREEFLSKTSKKNPLRLLASPVHNLCSGEIPETFLCLAEEKSNSSASAGAAGGSSFPTSGWTFVSR